MLDLNTAGAQRPDGVIPDGTYARVLMTLKGGGYSDQNLPPGDQGLLRASKSSSAVMLDAEFTVVTGPHAGRKFWQLFTVMGGKTNEKGESTAGSISLRALRGVIESARSIRADDTTPEGNAARVLAGFHVFHGMEFAAKIGVEDGGDYPDKNSLAHAVTPDEPEYNAIMTGQPVEAKPTRRRAKAAAGGAAETPAWQKQAASAAPAAWSTAAPASTPAPVPNGYAPVPQQQPAQPAAPAADGGPSWLRG